MKIAYITAQTPYGAGESFIPPEVIELRRQGHEVVVFPLRPAGEIGKGAECEEVAKYTVRIPLFSFSVLLRTLRIVVLCPRLAVRVFIDIVKGSGSMKKILKNLVVVPKGFVLGEEMKKMGFAHIHAHWASTPSTAAYIASLYSGIPWSLTAHQWDIKEDNMLETKIRFSEFVRAISVNGANEIKSKISKTLWHKVNVIHMGVRLPSNKCSPEQDVFTIASVGNLIPVKGHRFLLEACLLLKQRGKIFKCFLIGDGPLKQELSEMIQELDVGDVVTLCGRMPHDKVLGMYQDGCISVLVHPSIVTEDGEREGIPVALMEAMAFGVPVISTNTGGIPELLGDGSGILVPPADSKALADAIEVILENSYYRAELGQKGRKKIERDFSLTSVVRQLAELFQKHA